MDPYIEDPNIWPDFHQDLAAQIRAELNRQVLPRYVAKIVPRVTYEIIEIEEKRGIRPDLAVWGPTTVAGQVFPSTAPVTPAPAESIVELEVPLKVFSVEIHEVGTLRLVTSIEILSPVNKRASHEAYDEYLRKRRELLRSQTHLIEIDLLRGGTRPPLQRPVPTAAYYVVLSRVSKRPYVAVWPIQLQDKLPVLPVPLVDPDPDVALDLNAMVAVVYERGGYSVLIDYQNPPPPPPLSNNELIWMEQLLRPLRERN